MLSLETVVYDESTKLCHVSFVEKYSKLVATCKRPHCHIATVLNIPYPTSSYIFRHMICTSNESAQRTERRLGWMQFWISYPLPFPTRDTVLLTLLTVTIRPLYTRLSVHYDSCIYSAQHAHLSLPPITEHITSLSAYTILLRWQTRHFLNLGCLKCNNSSQDPAKVGIIIGYKVACGHVVAPICSIRRRRIVIWRIRFMAERYPFQA
jgi:hypothetical protein